jgi:type IV secretory pathway TrbD component
MRDMKLDSRRRNRVFKSLHKPLTYLCVERTLFYFICVGAVGACNLLNSILAGVAVFIGGYAFGHWATSTDPAFLRILAKSERYKLRLDAPKQKVPRVGGALMLRPEKSSKMSKEAASLNNSITIFEDSYLNVIRESRNFITHPCSLELYKENLQFFLDLFRVLIKSSGQRYRNLWAPEYAVHPSAHPRE